MTALVIYDDRQPIPTDGQHLVGVRSYSRLLHKKSTLLERSLQLFDGAGLTRVRVLSGQDDADRLLQEWDDLAIDWPLLYLPSALASIDSDKTELFLRKIRYLRESFRVCFNGDEHMLLAATPDQHRTVQALLRGATPAALSERLDLRRFDEELTGLSSLAQPSHLLEFLTTTFDARHFNAIRHSAHTITKTSTDRDKLRREAQVFGLLPDRLKAFFLPTWDLQVTTDHASYCMERLHMPDLAIQWVHGAIDRPAFEQLLDQLVCFIEARPQRDDEGRSASHLYQEKVHQRIDQLHQLEAAAPCLAMIATATASGSDLRELERRYAALLPRLQNHRHSWQSTISHGDLCFSNILYSTQNRCMRFIDPRGADDTDGLYLDAYYDIAKLSHSICGAYDFINHDLVDLSLTRDLRLQMIFPRRPDPDCKDYFLQRMQELGFDSDLIRLYEASLFLSMLPLHIDVPKKVVAFAVVADDILTDLERHQ